MYFIDELNGGNLYKYTSAARLRRRQVAAGRLLRRRPDLRAARRRRQHAERHRRLHAGCRSPTQTAPACPARSPSPTRNGVTSVDARNTTNLPAFKGTDYQRPEDMQIQTVQRRRVPLRRRRPPPTRSTCSNLKTQHDLGLRQPQHDRPRHGPAGRRGADQPRQPRHRPRRQHLHRRGPQRRRGRRHLVRQGPEPGRRPDSTPAKASARWASNGTPGSEFTGLYFDPTDKRRAWVNIQHPASGNDRTIEITIPQRRRRTAVRPAVAVPGRGCQLAPRPDPT